MTNQLFEEFDAANINLIDAQTDEAANEALGRRNAIADKIMYDPEIRLELRQAVAI